MFKIQKQFHLRTIVEQICNKISLQRDNFHTR